MTSWKAAENEFVSFFTGYGKEACVIRLPDTAAAKAVGGKNSFVAAQPSDFLLTLKGVTHYAEVKSSSNQVSFSFGGIQKGQWNMSRKIVRAGGSYLFFIKNQVSQQWYLIPAAVLHNHPKKSIKWKEIETYKWNNTLTSC